MELPPRGRPPVPGASAMLDMGTGGGERLATSMAYASVGQEAQVLAQETAGLPPLVGVDEAVSEPSPGAARAHLQGLGWPLSYPVALDTTGRLADGYGVQDQPWFALTSATGKVIWSHDGWLPVSSLEAVKKAEG